MISKQYLINKHSWSPACVLLKLINKHHWHILTSTSPRNYFLINVQKKVWECQGSNTAESSKPMAKNSGSSLEAHFSFILVLLFLQEVDGDSRGFPFPTTSNLMMSQYWPILMEWTLWQRKDLNLVSSVQTCHCLLLLMGTVREPETSVRQTVCSNLFWWLFSWGNLL